MSDFIKGVQVGNEVKQYDYDSLGNKPSLVQVDTTLTESGKAADAKVVGQKLKEANEHVNSEVSKVNNNSANALKGYAYGAWVSVDDVSPVGHTIGVVISGKNLLNCDILTIDTITKSGVTLTSNGNNSYTLSGSNNSGTTVTFGMDHTTEYEKLLTLPAGIYTACKGITVVVKSIDTGKTSNKRETFSMDCPFKIVAWYCFVTDANVVGGAYVGMPFTFTPQLEQGTTATEYTPYVNPSNATLTYGGQTYTPNSDGSVDDLISTSPTMEMSASDGFYVHLEYNRDTNAVIKKLTDAIVALGGTV